MIQVVSLLWSVQYYHTVFESRATISSPMELFVLLQNLLVFGPPSHVRVKQIDQATAAGLSTARPGSELRWYTLLILSRFANNSHFNPNITQVTV